MTGPGLVSRMPAATMASRGLATASTIAATPTSISRRAMAAHPPDRHEHLRRLQAGLGAPGAGPVLESLQGARMGVVAKLALVAGHRSDLGFERLADVDPGVGYEGPGIGPFGAAGGVEGIHGLD